MINKCVCGCNPQPGNLNINSNLNKDFNKVVKSPNQSQLNKQMLIQQLNNKPGVINCESLPNGQITSDLILEQLKNFNEKLTDIDLKINSFSSFKFEIVDSLPTENISETTIYLISSTNATDQNLYEEYIYINSKWELISTLSFDLMDTVPHIGSTAPLNKYVWLQTDDDEDVSSEEVYYTGENKSLTFSSEEELTFNEESESELVFNTEKDESLTFSSEEELTFNEE